MDTIFLTWLDGEREIVFHRKFSAPVDMVYRAHVDPELIKKWFLNKNNIPMGTCISQPRVGGTIHYEWDDGRGGIERLVGEYVEVTAERHLTHLEKVYSPNPQPTNVVMTDFSSDDDLNTIVTMKIICSNKACRDGLLESGIIDETKALYEAMADTIEVPATVCGQYSPHEGSCSK